ncbi:MAG: hypothetical protein GX811_00530, partial [Lentisphaerae bacterium]|nr:hypothetical protein [Lentisphaerota bacterium]
MTVANKIRILRGARFYIEDNISTTIAGYRANRLGTEGQRPSVELAGGILYVGGPNVAAFASTQTVGHLTIANGGSATVSVARRHASSTPTLILSGLSQELGATVNFTGNNLGTAATACSRIIFETPPDLIYGIMGGTIRADNAWATYDDNGVKALTVYDGTSIQNATMYDNISVTAGQAISSDVSVNSLFWNHNSTINLGTYGLTITSGGLMKINNNANIIDGTTGYVTAGSGDGRPIALNFFLNNSSQTLTLRALIKDNPKGAGNKVTVIRDGVATGSLTFSQADDNTYSGGTIINSGLLTSGSVADRRYFGSGPVTVYGAQLTLNAPGATSNSDG